MLPLPAPLTGGAVADLRALLNVKSDDDFELVLAWLLAAMRDRGPYPVLALMGEQGSAKTSCIEILRSLVDPSSVKERSFPREDRDLFIAASSGWVVAYGNVSRIPWWMSDALCRLATGGGFTTRKLYTDDEEQLFNAQRPIVLNGIEDFVERPDLADRAVFLTLEPIPEHRRKADQALQDEVAAARPLILGALLDRLVVGLERLPRTKLERLPRMADFALWGTACERAPGVFMRAYENNRASAVEIILEADLVATAVRTMMKVRGGEDWSGTSTALLKALNEVIDERQRRGREWPSQPNVLSGRLRRSATNLRKIGIEVTFEPGHKRGRLIHIAVIKPAQPNKERDLSSSPSSPSYDNKKSNGGKPLGGDDLEDDGGTMDRPRPDPLGGAGTMDRPHRPHTVHANALKNNGGDDVDDGDDDLRTQSAEGCVAAPIPNDYDAVREERLAHGLDDGLDIPTFLRRDPKSVAPDRRPALGPPGDSLDDLV
jgi:hypothetical protein